MADRMESSIKQIYYNGKSKVIRRLCELVNQLTELGQAAYEHSLIKSGNPHKIAFDDLAQEEEINTNAGFRNSIYRGKYLGSSLTTAQGNVIADGTFTDMYIGDYWTINNINYRIAAFDYWLNCGDSACTKHHIALVPDISLYSAKMNESNTTAGGYVGSKMYTENLVNAKTIVGNAFGSTHILSHREYLTNGYPSGSVWVDSMVELMNERMVYGNAIFTSVSNGSTISNLYTIDKGQLPLFHFEPSRITNRETWWLRDVVTDAAFACINENGFADYDNASCDHGVRPVFGLC